MFKKVLLYVLFALTMVSCEFRHILSEEELEALNRACLDFDIDWSALDEKPSGMTLYFFPCDENPIDTTVYHYSYNNVEHVRVYLPEQDYSVICINRSESEFADLKFNFSSYDSAWVMAKSSDEMTNVEVRYKSNCTRAYNATSRLKPKTMGVASANSVKSTRAYNATSRLKPKNTIQGMSMSVNVYGLNAGVRVIGKLTNLSAGVALSNRSPLMTRLDQSLGADSWNVTLPTADSLPGALHCSFGTFGVPTSNSFFSSSTRADLDAVEGDTLRNILDMMFYLPDGDSLHYVIDITDQLRAEFERILAEEREQENNSSGGGSGSNEIKIELGNSSDTEGSNSSDKDGKTSSGTLILHKTNTGTNVKVTEWEEHVIPIVL